MIYILLRYSLISKDLQKRWVVGRSNNFETYKNKILDQERLDFRYELLTKITLPSIQGQLNIDFDKLKVILFTSDQLPITHKNRLDMLKSIYPWLDVTYHNENISNDIFSTEVDKRVKKSTPNQDGNLIYSTLRLDDDDALGSDFLSRINEYMNLNLIGFGVSFLKGYAGILNDNKIQFKAIYSRRSYCTAIGLAYINSYNIKNKKYASKYISIYDLGNHIKVAEKTPIICCEKKASYIRTVYHGQDSDTQKIMTQFKNKSLIQANEVKKNFPFALKLLNLSTHNSTKKN